MRQTYTNCEIIVIDDGSTDRSLEIIKTFESDLLWESSENFGACRTRNRGIELAKGEFIKFLDADDVLLPDAIAKQVDISKTLPDSVICYGAALDYASRDPVLNHLILSHEMSPERTLGELVGGDIITSCPLHRKELLRRGAVFNSALKRGQEWHFHIRINPLITP